VNPFAPPGANQEFGAPPGANQEYAPPGADQEYAPPGPNREHGGPQPGPNQEYAPPGATREPHPPQGAGPDFGVRQGANQQDFSAPGGQDYSAPQQHQDRPAPNQEYAPPAQGAPNQNPAAPQQPAAEQPAPPVSQPAQQFYSAPAPDFGAPQQHPGYSAPPLPGEYAAPQPTSAPPGPNQEFVQTPAPEPQAPQQQYSAPMQPQHTGPIELPQAASAPPAYAPPGANRPAPPEPQTAEPPVSPPRPAKPLDAQRPRVPSRPPAPATPPPPAVVEQQTDQFPVVQPPPITEVSPAAVPSPPVTEQAPLRTAPADRPPIAEPTPPATVENPGPMPGAANPATTVGAPDTESARLVDAVRQVPGVRDAFHVTAPDGASSLRLELEDGVDPDEVHAVVSAVVNEQRAVEPGPQSVDEAEIRGHVESASTDVEVASVGPVDLRRVEIESAGLEAEVSVTLALGDTESTGKVAVPPIDWHIQHAAAAATVEALRPRLGTGDVRVEVEHASIVPTGPVKTAVVVILWLDGRSVRRLSGASVVTAERARAVVSATLGALAAEVAH
jgi:hypothetical protein